MDTLSALDPTERVVFIKGSQVGGTEALSGPYMGVRIGEMIKKRAGWLTILFVAGDPDTTCWTGETGDGLRSEVRGFRNFELRITPFPHVSRCTLRPYKSLYSYAGGLSHSPARVVRKILHRRLFSYTSR